MNAPVTVDLTSVGGIAVLTLLLIQGLKQAIAGTKFDKLPVALWVVGVSASLTYVAHAAGYIDLDLKKAIAQVVTSALVASGTFSLAKRGANTMDGAPITDPDRFSKFKGTASVLAVSAMLFAGQPGCALLTQPSQKDENFYRGVRAVWPRVERDWKPRVAAAPDLTAQEKLNRIGPSDSLASEMDALIESRAKDFD